MRLLLIWFDPMSTHSIGAALLRVDVTPTRIAFSTMRVAKLTLLSVRCVAAS